MIATLADGSVEQACQARGPWTWPQTLPGASLMVLEAGEHPVVCKDTVTSPEGTAIAGLAGLERGGLRSALTGAVEAASIRSAEPGG